MMKTILVELIAIVYMQMKLARTLNLRLQEIVHCPVELAANESLTDLRAERDEEIDQK